MDKAEAQSILDRLISELRALSYAELVDRYLKESVHSAALGASGAEYQVEVMGFWDDGQPGNLRVIVAIDDGRWSAFRPLSTDFIKAPDGTFVGE